MSLDHQKATALAGPGQYNDTLEHIARNEASDTSKANSSAIADYQVLYIGTTESKLRQLV